MTGHLFRNSFTVLFRSHGEIWNSFFSASCSKKSTSQQQTPKQSKQQNIAAMTVKKQKQQHQSSPPVRDEPTASPILQYRTMMCEDISEHLDTFPIMHKLVYRGQVCIRPSFYTLYHLALSTAHLCPLLQSPSIFHRETKNNRLRDGNYCTKVQLSKKLTHTWNSNDIYSFRNCNARCLFETHKNHSFQSYKSSLTSTRTKVTTSSSDVTRTNSEHRSIWPLFAAIYRW